LSFMVHAFVSPVPAQLNFFVSHTSDKVCAGVAMICYLLHSSTKADQLKDGLSWGCGPFDTHVISTTCRASADKLPYPLVTVATILMYRCLIMKHRQWEGDSIYTYRRIQLSGSSSWHPSGLHEECLMNGN
jgi:hypothetical protein